MRGCLDEQRGEGPSTLVLNSACFFSYCDFVDLVVEASYPIDLDEHINPVCDQSSKARAHAREGMQPQLI